METGEVVVHDTPQPASEQTLMSFSAYCFNVLRLTYPTIKLYLAGVRYHFLKRGIPNPMYDGVPPAGLHRLNMVLRGIKKQQNTREKRFPITYAVLERLCSSLSCGFFGKFVDTMLKAVFSLAFFAFLRCGEFTTKSKNPQIQEYRLQTTDISFCDGGDAFEIKLHTSKTDPFRQGIVIKVFKSGKSVCPVFLMRKYLHLKQTLHLDKHYAALFLDETGNTLCRAYFIEKLKVLLERLGYKHQRYNGHSFRIGAATSAAEGGVEDHLIKTLGRWSSDCYTRYIRTTDRTLAAAQQAMCKL